MLQTVHTGRLYEAFCGILVISLWDRSRADRGPCGDWTMWLTKNTRVLKGKDEMPIPCFWEVAQRSKHASFLQQPVRSIRPLE